MESARDAIILRNGVGIPCIGYSTGNKPLGEVGERAIHQALSDGYRHFDTQPSLDHELVLGRALASSGLKRGSLFVGSKVGESDRGYESTLSAFERTRKNLHLDYLDLYVIQGPALHGDLDERDRVNLETWRALETLYLDGLVKAIGVSEFREDHLEALMDKAEILPMVNQIEMHPGCNQTQTREYCRRHDIVVEAKLPLADGVILENETLADIAAGYGCTVAQLCLRWCLQSRAIPLLKSVQPDFIAEDARIFWFDISEEDMNRIDELEPISRVRNSLDAIEL